MCVLFQILSNGFFVNRIVVADVVHVHAAGARIGALLAAAGLAAPRIATQALTMEDVFIHRVLALEAAARPRAAA